MVDHLMATLLNPPNVIFTVNHITMVEFNQFIRPISFTDNIDYTVTFMVS